MWVGLITYFIPYENFGYIFLGNSEVLDSQKSLGNLSLHYAFKTRWNKTLTPSLKLIALYNPIWKLYFIQYLNQLFPI